jgi:hypothetical protein
LGKWRADARQCDANEPHTHRNFEEKSKGVAKKQGGELFASFIDLRYPAE